MVLTFKKQFVSENKFSCPKGLILINKTIVVAAFISLLFNGSFSFKVRIVSSKPMNKNSNFLSGQMFRLLCFKQKRSHRL